jgi:hypothetical protein
MVCLLACSLPSEHVGANILLETPPINYRQGESSPGLAARLGMGIGIPLLGLLLIAEIVFLALKYGLSSSARRRTYDIPMSHRL